MADVLVELLPVILGAALVAVYLIVMLLLLCSAEAGGGPRAIWNDRRRNCRRRAPAPAG